MKTLIVDRFATSHERPEDEGAIELGAHLVSDRDGYTHHGIYVGNGLVIHYGGFHHSAARRPVEYVGLRAFCAGCGVKVQAEPAALYRGCEAVERAKSRLGEDRYRLLTNNCEHFCTWCVQGTGRSEQVRRCLSNPWAGVKTLLALSRARRAFHRRASMARRQVGEWLPLIAGHSRAPLPARA